MGGRASGQHPRWLPRVCRPPSRRPARRGGPTVGGRRRACVREDGPDRDPPGVAGVRRRSRRQHARRARPGPAPVPRRHRPGCARDLPRLRGSPPRSPVRARGAGDDPLAVAPPRPGGRVRRDQHRSARVEGHPRRIRDRVRGEPVLERSCPARAGRGGGRRGGDGRAARRRTERRPRTRRRRRLLRAPGPELGVRGVSGTGCGERDHVRADTDHRRQAGGQGPGRRGAVHRRGRRRHDPGYRRHADVLLLPARSLRPRRQGRP